MQMKCLIRIAATLLFSLLLARPGSIILGAVDNILVCESSTCQSLTGGAQPGAVTFSGVQNGGGTNYTINGLADGTQGPADLRAMMSYSVPAAASYYTQIQSGVQYWDALTVAAPGQATGATGYVTLIMTINGITTGSGGGQQGFTPRWERMRASPISSSSKETRP